MKRPTCRREPVPRRARTRRAAALHGCGGHDRVGNRGMQQALAARRDRGAPATPEMRDAARRGGVDQPPDGIQVRWGPDSERAASELDAVAFTIGSDVFVDTGRFPPGTRDGDLVLAHEFAHAAEQCGREPELALLSEAQFRAQLGARPEQAVAIDALFANPTFKALWDYLGACPAVPTRDHGPIRLLVTPGLHIGGVERFGGYNGLTRTLQINPTKAEHVSNVSELVDTIVHEVLHAISDVEADCMAAGGVASPAAGAGTTAPVTGGPPPLGPVALGPSPSDPCNASIDIDVAAQRIVLDIIRENMRGTRLGVPTLMFLNELIRSDPAALAAYDACRTPACAIADAASRAAAIARCSMETLGTFMTGDLLPSRVLFDSGSAAVRPDAATALDLAATFLRGNPGVHVTLQGHSDPSGSNAYNTALGQRRAEAVGAFLVGRGVAAGQIDGMTSAGEQHPISTRPRERFQDRRVELVFTSTP